MSTLPSCPFCDGQATQLQSNILHDNQKHRALFTLPPISESTSREIEVPAAPLREIVTGDDEIDAVLWLQKVIATGIPDLIERAMQAARRIETPIATIEKRYRDIIDAKNPRNPLAGVLATSGFGDFERHAKKATRDNDLKREAIARFGSEEAALEKTSAEIRMVQAIKRVKFKEGAISPTLNSKAITAFQAQLDSLPHTLNDCLYEFRYWDDIYKLRNAVSGGFADASREEWVRRDFLFWLMAKIRPRNKAEALAVMEFMLNDGDGSYMDRADSGEILTGLLK